jgi:hypothetical protein
MIAQLRLIPKPALGELSKIAQDSLAVWVQEYPKPVHRERAKTKSTDPTGHGDAHGIISWIASLACSNVHSPSMARVRYRRAC